jgi:hypothetical protein
MKTKVACIIAAAALAMSVSSTAAASADDDRTPPTAQTEKAKEVVAAKEPASTHVPGPQQMKMKHCNEEAKKKELKGDERRAFMSTCLKG